LVRVWTVFLVPSSQNATNVDTPVGGAPSHPGGSLPTPATVAGYCSPEPVLGRAMVGPWFWGVVGKVFTQTRFTCRNCSAGGRTVVSFGTPVRTPRWTFNTFVTCDMMGVVWWGYQQGSTMWWIVNCELFLEIVLGVVLTVCLHFAAFAQYWRFYFHFTQSFWKNILQVWAIVACWDFSELFPKSATTNIIAVLKFWMAENQFLPEKFVIIFESIWYYRSQFARLAQYWRFLLFSIGFCVHTSVSFRCGWWLLAEFFATALSSETSNLLLVISGLKQFSFQTHTHDTGTVCAPGMYSTIYFKLFY